MIQLTSTTVHPKPSDEILKSLQDGLATCASGRALSPEARRAIARLCEVAHESAWNPEQLVIVVKEACYSSPEMWQRTTTSEREALLATIVTECIQEFYTPLAD
jgi:hypothetical protein